MSQLCAYCGTPAVLTREHVVPNFIYKKNPLGKFGYNSKAGAFLSWEAQVKDVCARCNNEHLSRLDAYLKCFHDDNDVDSFITEEKTVNFRYDYSLLCRSLLKLSYNCLRFKGAGVEQLKPFSDYILFGLNSPANLKVKLGVEVVRCHRITDEERKHLDAEAASWAYLPPHVIRFGQLGGSAVDDLIVRYVFLKNYCFFLIIFSSSLPERMLRKAFIRFSDALPDVVFLNFEKKSVTVKVSHTDALDRYTDAAMAVADKWTAYLAAEI